MCRKQLKWQLEFATRHIEALEEKIEKDTVSQLRLILNTACKYMVIS